MRIERTLREMDIKSVAVFSDADRGSLHVRLADEAVCIGPAPGRESYLNIEAIISAAKITGADAVHPGYGFLSENPAFSKAVTKAGLVFIGPSPETIEMLGVKSSAREIAIKAGVPVIPGSDGVVTKNHLQAARKVGFPLMIKATMGGGGKGMRAVLKEEDFMNALQMAQNEARNAFGDDRVYFERLVLNPRHIEVQIAADSHGKILAFTERDCSMQRRHQKLLEESPSPFVTPEVRLALADAAKKMINKAKYTGVGTVEFLMDENKDFYFMEVNTRLQVEHPVTEAVCGLDLVKMQIVIAEGAALDYASQDEALSILCHAVEYRINAEDSDNNFSPCPGIVEEWIAPGGLGVRLDTHMYTGYTIPSYYDSLMAKLIINAPDRERMLHRSRRALEEFKVGGVKTTIKVHKQILDNKDFCDGNMNTGLLEKILVENKK